ncbi:terminase small subunit [Paraburkholderia tagetis]|uniref:Terminase small subunit n=1 Tax=Paraburkholderia tagetis TaxID=2913261 RepID=A0A9X1UK49_9BURK|nr:terminase small subunit [Paraburkholderia tagetis]MCG5072266.1 terminase small subunit [Paraburkholderia tagetis]
MALTDKQRRFVDEYLVDLNATQAAIRAGYSSKRASEIGHQLLQKTTVQKFLAERQRSLQARTEITQEMVLKRYWDIATADPNELVQYRRFCCRHCWGKGHAYQWTETEFVKAQLEAGDEPLDASGGYGFDMNREPHPACPECGGVGKGKVHVTDTRKLRGASRLLYAGVKVGKEGLEVKMHDQLKALDAVARHIGFDKSKVEISGPNGGPIETHELSDAERAARVTALLDAARARRDGQTSGGKGQVDPASGPPDTGI